MLVLSYCVFVVSRRPNNFEKKNKISKYLKVLINGTASAIASDHLWSMVRQSVASKCVYTNATCTYPYITQCTWCAETIHWVLNWTTPCFMYVQASRQKFLGRFIRYGRRFGGRSTLPEALGYLVQNPAI